jgi:hypothetical protein
VGWRNFVSSSAVVSVFWFLVGNRFWCYIFTYLEYNTVVAVLAGNSFWCYICTHCTIQLCGCVSFLFVAGNSSQNENTFLGLVG